jgi:hypothetical protein
VQDMAPKRPTPAWPIAIAITLVAAWALSAHAGVRDGTVDPTAITRIYAGHIDA